MTSDLAESPAVPQRTSQGAKTVERVLDAAEDLFAAKGFDGTSMREVAGVAGIRAPSLYNHFPNKEALYAGVLARAFGPGLELLETFLARGEEAYREPTLLKDFLALLAERPNVARLMHYEVLSGGEHMNRLLQEWIASLWDKGLAAMQRSPKTGPWRREELPHLLFTLMTAITGNFALAPGYSHAFGGDVFNDRALEEHARFLASYRGAMVFDAARGEVVLFPGSPAGGSTNRDSTWTWNGVAWTRHAPGGDPAPWSRNGHGLVYDSARQVVVLFGSDSFLGDTWEWNGSGWTLRLPSTAPWPSSAMTMAYDAARGETVLLGEDPAIGSGSASETWVWDGTDWEERTPAAAPPVRHYGAMAYDPAHQVVILYGGFSSGQQLINTWTWDGATWTELTPANNPGARWVHQMVFDASRNRVVLFGGSSPGGFRRDLWEWTGTDWVEISVGTEPSARNGYAMAYDSSRDRLVLLGGYDASTPYLADTWEYGALTPQTTVASGAGCPADGPALVAHGTPTLGSAQLALDLIGAQPAAACLFGLSAGGRSLPIGSCTLYLARPFVLLGDTTSAAGHATLGVPIPLEPLLAGVDLHCQGFALDPAAPLGLAFTGALVLTLGE